MTEYLTFTVQTSKWLMIDRLTDYQIVFGDVLDGKASPDYKNIAVYAWSPNWIFRKGFSSRQVWSKILNFFLACIWEK